jgi:hypothetical protein
MVSHLWPLNIIPVQATPGSVPSITTKFNLKIRNFVLPYKSLLAPLFVSEYLTQEYLQPIYVTRIFYLRSVLLQKKLSSLNNGNFNLKTAILNFLI